MSPLHFLALLVVAGICGSIGRAIAGYSHGGCLVSIAVGFIGAMLGRFLSEKLSLPDFLSVSIGGKEFPIVWSILGATIFVAAIGLLTRKKS